MDILGITEVQFFAFMLILLRISSLFAFAPVLSSPFLPVRVKAAVVLGLSVSLAVLGVGGEVPVPNSISLVAFFAIQEVVVGLLIGFIARLVFVAIQFGGQVVGFEMGLGIVSVMDPQFEAQISLVSQFQFLLAIFLFLGVGGDRHLIEMFALNLREIPPGRMVFGGPAVKALVHLSAEVFRMGLQISAPVVAALFASNVILGVFARSVPQMNMLILGFPLKILVGFTVLGLSLPHWGRVFLRSLTETFEALRGLPDLLR